MKKNFSADIISALLDDPAFFCWLIAPTPELDAYWQKRMNEDECLKENIETLVETIKNLKVVEELPSLKDKEEIWAKIEKDIQVSGYRSIKRWKSALSIAAFLAILLSGYWMFTEHGQNVEDFDYSAFLTQEPESLRSEEISLVLSDNRSIQIKDSTLITYTDEGIVVGTEKVEQASTEPQLNQLIVPYGKTTSVILCDGTKVWMNSGSKLIYPSTFEQNKREVFLVGEAFLDVVPNEKKPFVVRTNHLVVNVLGTCLNVTAYEDDDMQSVLLVSGKVDVRNGDMKQKLKISPNEKMRYEISSGNTKIEEVDVNYYISWIYGYLLLNKERLPQLLHKLERHYNVSFTYNEADIRNFSVSGKLDLDAGINEVMNFIALTTPVVYELKDDSILIKLRK